MTLGVLKEYLADTLHVHVRRKVLWQYMKNHNYTFVSGVPTENTRLEVKVEDLLNYYNVTLPNAIEGVNPALVFNMDEMGAERYADRKRINVIFPVSMNPRNGMPVGVQRTTHRCTLVVCIALDGSRLKPALITKNKTLNTRIFESGYSPENVTFSPLKIATSRVMFSSSG